MARLTSLALLVGTSALVLGSLGASAQSKSERDAAIAAANGMPAPEPTRVSRTNSSQTNAGASVNVDLGKAVDAIVGLFRGKMSKEEAATRDNFVIPPKYSSTPTPTPTPTEAAATQPVLTSPVDAIADNKETAVSVRDAGRIKDRDSEVNGDSAKEDARGPKDTSQDENQSDERPIIMRNADLPLYVDREILVFAKGDHEAMDALYLSFDLELISVRAAPSIGVNMMHARIAGTRSVEETVRQLEKQSAIAWAQPNYVYQLLGNSREDGLAMHGLNDGATMLPKGLPEFDPATTVAIIDSPVDNAHASLLGARIEQRGTLANAPASPHGTAIAEILIGTGEFGGVASGAQLVSIPAFTPIDADDWHAPATSTSARLIDALELAGEIRPNVLNLSWGTLAHFDEAISREINQLYSEGVCIAAAAGNSANEPVLFPAKMPSTIAVAAVDTREDYYQHGSRGAEIDISAWGVDINAAVPGGRRSVTGTSFAAPVVAGAMLLMPACGDARKPQALRLALSRDAKDLGANGRDPVFGAGLLRFREAALGSSELSDEEILAHTPVFASEADEGANGLLYSAASLIGVSFLLFLIWRRRKREGSSG